MNQGDTIEFLQCINGKGANTVDSTKYNTAQAESQELCITFIYYVELYSPTGIVQDVLPGHVLI